MQRISEDDASVSDDILYAAMVWMNHNFSLVSDYLPDRTILTNAGQISLRLINHSTAVNLYADFVEDMELLNPRAAQLSEFMFYRIWAIAFPWVCVSSPSNSNTISRGGLTLSCCNE
jgi:hypothetical protein